MSSEEIAPSLEKNPFSVGTLTYTKWGLVSVFVWILWGDVAYTVMTNIFPQILQLYMLAAPGGPEGGLGASNLTVQMLTNTIPQIIGVVVCPIVSFRSDRCRSRWGRRIPYIAITAPFLCFFLGGLGFTREISNYFQHADWILKLGLSKTTVTIGIIGFFTVGFCFCYEFVGSVYWYLFADVVPAAFMGRFLGLFRMVGFGAGWAFNRYLFPQSLRNPQLVYGIAAVLYLLAFGLLCWKVKEGEYPPVTDVDERTSVLDQVKIYLRECFSHPIYVFIFVGTGLFGITTLINVIGNVFAKDALGITMDDIGKVKSWGLLVSLAISYPCGWLSDKFHPLRVTLISVLAVAVISVLTCFFMRDLNSYWLFTILGLVAGGVYGAAGIPLLMVLLPRSRYGQFCSANGMFKSAVIVVFGPITGWFLDWLTFGGKQADNYRYGYLCIGVLYVLYGITLFCVARYWNKLGGMRGYVAPGVAEETVSQTPKMT